MIIYERFYRKLGFNKIGMFNAPIIVPNKDIIYPFNTTMIVWDVEDTLTPITREILGVDKARRTHVKFVPEMTQDTVGHPRRNAVPILGTFNIVKSKDTSIKFYRPNQNFPTLTPRDLQVFSYMGLNHLYKYPSNVMLSLFKFQNILNTVIDKVIECNDREVFLPIPLPVKLPNFHKLERFAIRLPLETIKTITSYKQLLILELWKYLVPETKKNSIFSRIPEEQHKDITLVITNGENNIFINLDVFKRVSNEGGVDTVKTERASKTIETLEELEMVEDLELYSNPVKTEGDFKFFGRVQFKPLLFRKLFYIMLNKFLNSKPDTVVNTKDDTIVVKKDTDKLSKTLNEVSEVDEEKPTEKVKTIDKKKDVNLDKLADNVIKETIPEGKEEPDAIDNSATKLESNPDGEEGDNIEPEINKDTIDFTLQRHVEEIPIKEVSIQQIKEEKQPNQETSIVETVTKLKDNGLLSKAEERNIRNVLKEQPNKPSPFKGDNLKVRDYLQDDIIQDFDPKEAEITDNISVFDKSFNKNTTKALEKKYIKTQLKKDLMKTIYSVQNNKMVVLDHEIKQEDNILENTETHNVRVKLLNGAICNLKVDLPVIEEDGTFKMSGNRYLLRKQRTEIPIRKIDGTTVVLNSYYGKLFIKKAVKKKDDIGYWYFKTLSKMFEEGTINNLVVGNSSYPDLKLPNTYTKLSRYVKSFIFKTNRENYTFYFDYHEMNKKLKDLKLKLNGNYPIAYNPTRTKVLVINDREEISLLETKTGQLTVLEPFDSLLGLNIDNKPLENITVKIFKQHIPIVIFLGYYLGLEATIKMLKVKYEKKEKVSSKDINPAKEYILKFKDTKLVLQKDFGIGDLILGSLLEYKFLGDTDLRTWNQPALYGTIFNYLELRNIAITEIKLLENMFVDPITKSILEAFKQPVTFKGLLVRAAELLIEDNYVNPNTIDGQIIRGYERLSGMLYKELVTSLKDYENKSSYTKAKLTIDPYAIKNKLKEDSTTVLLDNLNPIAAIKQTEDVSYLGEGGRQAISMVKRTRVMHESEVGVISEGVKDNGEVGVTAYLSADPKISNIRGMVTNDDKQLEWSNIYSTTGLLAPFSSKDDPKRIKFVNIQSSHIVPINGARAPYVRTGYDSIIGVRVNDKFVTSAEMEGEVLDVKPDSVTIKYKNGETIEYKKKSWTSKEESETCYTFHLDTALVKGDKIKKDDTILYVREYFQPDIFNRKRVIYKDGTVINVALTEDPETFEDSGSISHKLTHTLGTKLTKVRSVVLSKDDEIYDIVKVGDKTEPTDPLFSFSSGGSLDTKDKQLMNILKDIKSNSPKAKIQGTIVRVQLFYNCEKKELSHSLFKLAELSDKQLKRETGYPGKVNSSYSIKGKPLLEGEVEIKIYIESVEDMGVGDKAIFSNQCKFTVGSIFNNECKTDNGEEVLGTFGFTSILHRIVNSPILIGTTGMLIEKIEKDIVDMYFKNLK